MSLTSLTFSETQSITATSDGRSGSVYMVGNGWHVALCPDSASQARALAAAFAELAEKRESWDRFQRELAAGGAA